MPHDEKAYQREYRKNNRERQRELERRYYQAHSERIRARSKAWYENNKERAAARGRAYYVANSDRIKSRNKNYNQKNKSKISAKNSAWKRANRDKVNASVRRLFQTDPHTRIAYRIRSNITQCVRGYGGKKAFKTIELLGCSVESFRIYIESKFEPDMTWDNIQLDHIVPCALFDLTKPEHQKRCFHFSNYQPLLIEDNLRKGARLFHEPDTLGI